MQRLTDDDAIASALQVLALDHGATWADIRLQYRSLVRKAHPDVAGDGTDATERTAELNNVLEILRAATAQGEQPLHPRPLGSAVADEPANALQPRLVLHAPPGDIFVQLLEAAHELGDVCYIDPEAGLIELLLEDGPSRPRLMIAIDREVDPAQASFTLDSADAATAPHLGDIVDRVVALLRHGPSGTSDPPGL